MNNVIQTFLSNQLSLQTRKAYRHDIDSFLEYVKVPLTKVNEANVIEYRNALASKRAPESVNRALSAIRSLYDWGVNTKAVTHNPALFVKPVPVTIESKTPGLSDDEAKKLLEASKCNTKCHAIISVLLYLGLRRSELCSLTLSSIIIERTSRALSIRGKGGKVRRVPLTLDVDSALQKHISNTFFSQNTLVPQDTFIFFSKTPNKPMHPRSIHKIVDRLCKLAGIQVIAPHSLRATAASNAIDNGANFIELQYAFGWSNPTMVNRYDKRRAEMKNSAVHKINYGSK